jgi:hypothetical protein
MRLSRSELASTQRRQPVICDDEALAAAIVRLATTYTAEPAWIVARDREEQRPETMHLGCSLQVGFHRTLAVVGNNSRGAETRR